MACAMSQPTCAGPASDWKRLHPGVLDGSTIRPREPRRQPTRGRSGGAGGRFPVRWCIGCGAIENLQPCLGPCDERKLEIVRADEHDEVLARVDQGRGEVETLTTVVLEPASTSPLEDGWYRSYREMRDHGRLALRGLEPPGGGGLRELPADRVTTWLCVACGRIEAPQECIGVCVRPTEEVVRAEHHDDAVARLEVIEGQRRALSGLVGRLAGSGRAKAGSERRPRRAMREEARGVLERFAPTASQAS